MNYKKLIGFGILIWIIAFGIASAFVAFNAINSLIAKLIVPVVIGIVAFFAGKNLKLKNIIETLKYSASWVIIGIILDALITVQFTGWEIFMQLDVWFGYFLVLVAPIIATRLSFK